MMSILDVILYAFGALTIVIYSALIAFLIVYRHEFNSSFYKIFISLGIADMFNRIFIAIFLFFPSNEILVGLFAAYPTGFVPVFGLFMSHFMSFSEAFGHLMMAANRFTALKYPFQYTTMWRNRRLYLAIAAQWLIAFLIPFFLWFTPCGYVASGTGPFYFETYSPAFSKAKFGVTFAVIVGVTLITLALNLFALIGYIQNRSTMTSQQKQSIKIELRLFSFSIAVFLIYCLLAADELYSLVTNLEPTVSWSWSAEAYWLIIELVCDANPYLLLMTSSAVRHQFFNLLFGCCNRTIVKPELQLNTGGNFVQVKPISESKPTA